MAGTPIDHHKRSKSSLAVSFLGDRFKTEHKDAEGSRTNISDFAPSLNSHSASSVNLDSGRHSSAKEIKTAADPGMVSSASGFSASPTDGTSLHEAAGSASADQGTSIEQSVRMFKVFEALRSGDTAAILKTLKESPTTAESDSEQAGRQSTSAPGASGILEGTTVVHLAIQCAELPVVEFILSNTKSPSEIGIDLNSRDRDGNTPLHLAAMLGRGQIVRLLLEQPGINDSIANYQARLPIDLARTPDIYTQLQLARSLFLDSVVQELQSFVARGEYEKIEGLLTEPRVKTLLDINGTELASDPHTAETGGTLLHEAARKKDARLIQILLYNGADPFRRDHKGKLPQEVTKDDKTRSMLKRSPAAAAAQRSIQEKAVLGNASSQAFVASGSGSTGDALASKEGREMKGYLKKWTNYTSGYKLRWFVLEDGVLSYYKHQDDAGSACRGAINMRIAKLFMDPQDKQKFEIQGKSSVKYHLKANHVVEAKRWYWALNNAIQWTKDEAKEEEKKKARNTELTRQARIDQVNKSNPEKDNGKETSSIHSRKRDNSGGRHLIPGYSVSLTGSRSAMGDSTNPGGSIAEDEDGVAFGSVEPSLNGEIGRNPSYGGTVTIDGDLDDEDDYGDDASSHEVRPASKDALNITAQSAKLQLELLGQVAAALQVEKNKHPDMTLSNSTVLQALTSYEAAVRNLKNLVGDLLKISKDRDAYWQYRLDREADIRKLWEESMARVARDQEALEDRMGESEVKRKRTKRALREALENGPGSGLGSRRSSINEDGPRGKDFPQTGHGHLQADDPSSKQFVNVANRRKSTIAQYCDISDSEVEEDEEFFDAIDAGEVEVVEEMPLSPVPQLPGTRESKDRANNREAKAVEIDPSFKGYEEGIRKRLKLDADNRPKISLWGILKSMIGKDMTKMTLPVSFNEPTSLLQRVAEDMEYTDLLDTAADRSDSTERLVYVATFAASEYASTIGRVAKPFNPLLGETYEYARPDKGYRFFIEQVSHHPPVGAACAESAKWDYYGESAVKSKFYGKSFEFNPLGTWFLKLRPASGGEELYTWKKVTSSVVGIITNNPTVDNYGPMEVKNWTTGEVCILDFKARGWRAAGAYQVQGKVQGADGLTKWSIGGHWNDKIYARPGPQLLEAPEAAAAGDAKGSTKAILVWQAHERPTGIPFNLTPFVVTLNALPDKLRPVLPPTDTRLRPDQRAMEDGEYDFAATEKNRVEEKQRAKRRQREERGEEFTPKWFSRGRCEITGEEYWVFNGRYWKNRDEVAKGGQWNGPEDIF